MECQIYQSLDVTNLSERDFEMIRDAVPVHGVICLKGQSLTMADQVSLTRRMGEPVYIHEALRFSNTLASYPEVARVSNIRADGSLIPDHHAAEYWHSDGDFWQPGRNYVFNFLYAEIVPPVGGETAFADLRLAYESLDESVRQQIDGMEVVVSCDEIPDFAEVAPEQREPVARHLVKHLHPETQRTGLYFGHTKARIDHISEDLSDSIMAEFTSAIERPENQYVHSWEPGDLLIWDNTSVMHQAMGGYGNNRRLLIRSQAFMTPKTVQAASSQASSISL